MYLKAIEISNAKQRDELLYFYKSLSGDDKIKKVIKLYEKLEIPNLVKQIIKRFHSQALSYLDLIESNNKEPLYKFAEELFDRKS